MSKELQRAHDVFLVECVLFVEAVETVGFVDDLGEPLENTSCCEHVVVRSNVSSNWFFRQFAPDKFGI